MKVIKHRPGSDELACVHEFNKRLKEILDRLTCGLRPSVSAHPYEKWVQKERGVDGSIYVNKVNLVLRHTKPESLTDLHGSSL